jgi:hypothetical protein
MRENMAPLDEPPTTPIGGSTPLQNAARNQGEVSELVERLNMAVANLEQEFSMLPERLNNVLPNEAQIAPGGRNITEPSPSPNRTILGSSLFDSVSRIDGVASSIRTMREILEN